jgi:hypothetical protein
VLTFSPHFFQGYNYFQTCNIGLLNIFLPKINLKSMFKLFIKGKFFISILVFFFNNYRKKMIAKNTCPNSSFKYQKYPLIIFFKSTKYLPKIFTNYQNDPTKLYFNNNFIGQTNSNWDT